MKWTMIFVSLACGWLELDDNGVSGSWIKAVLERCPSEQFGQLKLDHLDTSEMAFLTPKFMEVATPSQLEVIESLGVHYLSDEAKEVYERRRSL